MLCFFFVTFWSIINSLNINKVFEFVSQTESLIQFLKFRPSSCQWMILVCSSIVSRFVNLSNLSASALISTCIIHVSFYLYCFTAKSLCGYCVIFAHVREISSLKILKGSNHSSSDSRKHF